MDGASRFAELLGRPDPMGDATATLEARRRQQVTDAGYPGAAADATNPFESILSALGPTINERAVAAREALRRGDMATANALNQSLALDFGQFLGSIKPIRAYHGSPHDFDRFDMSKIGTGEGGQAYGRGLYFAENERVAKAYRSQLSDGTLLLDGKPVETSGYGNWDYALKNQFGGDIVRMQAALKADPHMPPENIRLLDDLVDRGYGYKPGGRMYEVGIHADPSKFLDWDVPLSAQTPSVRSALDDLGVVRTREPEWTVRQSPSGRWTVYNVWGESSGTFKDKAAAEAKAAAGTRDHNTGAAALAYMKLGGNHVYGSLDGGGASQKLNDAGIPGIKYLDKGSRAAGDGSRNYVVFDDKIVEILRKYGLLPPVAAGGAVAALPGEAEAAP